MDQGTPLALGFECPCFVPVREDEEAVLRQRRGEHGKAFSAAAGAFVLVDGLVESAWVLDRLGDRGVTATVDPARWPEPHGVLLWEAFVSGAGKGGPDSRAVSSGWLPTRVRRDVRDAATAVVAFARKGRPRVDHSDIDTDGAAAFNTLAAAALRAGLSSDTAELSCPSYAVKAR